MTCQQCRRPLRLDESLLSLDPAAADLLLESTGNLICPIDRAETQRSIPPERRQRYAEVIKPDLASPQDGEPSSIVKDREVDGAIEDAERPTAAVDKDQPDMSFMMLRDSELRSAREAEPPQPLKEKGKNGRNATVSRPKFRTVDLIKTPQRLFEVLSSKSDIDHPICAECADLIIKGYKTRLDDVTQERDAYIAYKRTLSQRTVTEQDVKEAQDRLESTKKLEAESYEELLKLEAEKAELDQSIAELELDSQALQKEEETVWRSRNAMADELNQYINERDAVRAAHVFDLAQLERLRRTNVFNDALHISSQGRFATINGLRLGRDPPSHPVEWSEINAAWGYAALLLATVADKFGFTFTNYRIIPAGSTSTIEHLGDLTMDRDKKGMQTSRGSGEAAQRPNKVHTLDLHSSGEFTLGMASLVHRRINAGMVAFLDCLNQMCNFIKPGSRSSGKASKSHEEHDDTGVRGLQMRMPYRIRGDKIGNDTHGYRSIKLGASTDEDWTDACRYTLTCCKYLLAAMNHRLESDTKS